MTYQVLHWGHVDLDGYREAIKEYTLKHRSHEVNEDGWSTVMTVTKSLI